MKHLSLLVTLCIILFATSCSDNDDNKFTETLSINQVYTVTAANGNITAFPASNFKYEIDYSKGLMDITLNNVRFSPKMPEITMELNDIPFTYTQNGMKINTQNIIPVVGNEPMESYAISTLTGRIVKSEFPKGSNNKISFNLVNGFTITAYPTPLIYEYNSLTSVSSNPNNTDSYINNSSTFKLVFDTSTSTASFYIDKASFAENMPKMNMVFKEIPFTANNSGFSLNAESLIPSIIGSTGIETQAPNYIISNINIKVVGDRINASFTCTITDKNNSAIGEYIVSASADMFPTELFNK